MCKVIKILLFLFPFLLLLLFVSYKFGRSSGYDVGYEHGFYDALPDYRCANYWKIEYNRMLKKRKDRRNE